MQSLQSQPLSYDAHNLYTAIEPLLSNTPLPTSLLYELAHAAVPPPPWRPVAYELAARKLLAVRVEDGVEHLCWYAALYKKSWWMVHSTNPFASQLNEWTDFTWDLWSHTLDSLSIKTENLENLNHALIVALRKGWVVTAKNGTRIKNTSNTNGN